MGNIAFWKRQSAEQKQIANQLERKYGFSEPDSFKERFDTYTSLKSSGLTDRKGKPLCETYLDYILALENSKNFCNKGTDIEEHFNRMKIPSVLVLLNLALTVFALAHLSSFYDFHGNATLLMLVYIFAYLGLMVKIIDG